MRARQPDEEGLVERGGVKIGYEVFGAGPQAVVLAPYWPIVPSRAWKMQVPYLSRHFRVVTVDGRAAGRSDHPSDPDAYRDIEFAEDIVAVLDTVGVERAVLVGHCSGAWWSTLVASRHPERVDGIFAIAPNAPYLTRTPEFQDHDFLAEDLVDEGWARYNRHSWRRDFPGFIDFYFRALLSDPHSTKLIEDTIGWGNDADPEALAHITLAPKSVSGAEEAAALLGGLRAPTFVVHGTGDLCTPYQRGEKYAELTGGELVTLSSGGHLPQARHPVMVNRWIRDFAERASPVPGKKARKWTRPLDRKRRVLFISSPIGLGHTRRDMAIAAELRKLRPDVTVDWLAQSPVAEALVRRGERVHPASAYLSSESAHWEDEADGHDLHAFKSLRRMDEILMANFGVFSDLVEYEPYDLWIGDEAWEVDYYLHENPELKRAPYAWLTDFVGWLPMPDGGPAEAALTADYNAEMIEQIARFPRLRDRSLFVGTAEDIVPDTFGDTAGGALPSIRGWTREHYAFTGYITGFDAAEIADRAALREEFGWAPDEPVCVVTVGGTGVGAHLMGRVLAAYPRAAELVPGLRMVVVTGPRIDPASFGPQPAGVERHAFLPDLYRYLAASDLAVVQGGLTTTMELTAAGRPFLYVPLRHHFEQNLHVPHRLARYGSGTRLDYADTEPEPLARAIAAHIGEPVSYRPVDHDGAARAAGHLAELF
jgi:pimeloyl-ACP methyl ester carboxylesterase